MMQYCYMSPTDSLRRDHMLIEKMIDALKTISSLLSNGKQIPESILNQGIDFSLNFTNTCHHGKEEESLFPTLEKKVCLRKVDQSQECCMNMK